MRDKVVVITGASSGIGAALAERVGLNGGRPVLAARRERELREVAARSGPQALPLVTDVSRRAEVQRLCDTALTHFGQIDVWVNNAGRGITRPVSQLTDEDLDLMMSINVKSALYGMQAVLPHFKERGRGHIINVSSMLGRIPYVPFRSAYSAAKHALNALTAALRMELSGLPEIHVSTVSPAVVATEFGLHALHGGPDSRDLPQAQPVEEVAKVISDLIERPSADVYTRPGMHEAVARYYSAEDLAAAESASPFAPPASRR
jgi:NAD(P)-dependent dehydrogenase (short-subunit alcohol dehydrogenase family)